MKDLGKLSLMLLTGLALGFTSCSDSDDEETPTPTVKGNANLQGTISANRTLDADTVYTLKGFVYVDNNATLTIEPGTIIKGEKATQGTLLIQRGAKIMAQGTAEKPIVFTSNQAKGSRAAGDWGGVVILGRAKNNQGMNIQVEGGPLANYGGENDADNSGVFSYVRIEYAGYPLQPNKELNGLTMGSVGSGTKIDHVQVSFGGDDAFEWFGGTVNATHLVAYRNTDDMFDTDYGYSGKVQYALGISDPNMWDVATGGASNGFESDNDGNGSTLTPLTTATFSNVTIVGPGSNLPTGAQFGQGAHLKKGTSLSIRNSIISGYSKGITLDGAVVEGYAQAGGIKIMNTIVAGAGATSAINKASSSTSEFNAATWFTASGNSNSIRSTADLGLATTAPYLPQSGSMVLSGASFTGITGFENAAFIGAFGTTNWTTGWTNWDPQNTDY
ncbi:T9SS C-terminal target domain-containing protein [Rufibacter sediminis]|uniref:T9SS C-terminal target domain-containing protein n=1 Tax=Rufibacter sediminis TaxID=2762756 RepID=A0ABR6VYE0_9BACT|nr:T9SS C-terminal target domain-containing protein [Rufibacter sediminis]MBC3541808.1 T9SS C-terminal target domain-containing protein [Rufibacter sediminis]